MLICLHGEDGVVIGEATDIDLTDADIARDLAVGDRLVDPEHANGKEEEGDRHQGKKGDAWLQGKQLQEWVVRQSGYREGLIRSRKSQVWSAVTRRR